tara:strand:+ start:8709 stop:9113 length:405 start_codon:yes stop_codon:yes gene_type:complete
MDNTCEDLLIEFSMYLSLSDTLNYLYTNKFIYKKSNNLFWKQKAYTLMGRDFWMRAHTRPIQTSKPLMCYKKELMRIEYFQKHIHKFMNIRWSNKNFYEYWNTIDKPTRAGFEPAREYPNGFQVHRLNHSAIVS